jgi:osmotically-inducible protein OsmY
MAIIRTRTKAQRAREAIGPLSLPTVPRPRGKRGRDSRRMTGVAAAAAAGIAAAAAAGIAALVLLARRNAKRAVHAANVATGKLHELAPTRATTDVNDPTLKQRVESEIFRAPDAPKDRVSVNAENGVVVLRGQLDSAQQIDALVLAATRVEGVAAVENLLNRPGG